MDVEIQETVIRVITVAPTGRIDAFNAPELRSHLEGMLAAGNIRFVVDLSVVSFIDSAGLAVLVSLMKRARLEGGDVRLVWPEQEGAQRIFKLTKFDRVFEMYPNRQAAAQAF